MEESQRARACERGKSEQRPASVESDNSHMCNLENLIYRGNYELCQTCVHDLMSLASMLIGNLMREAGIVNYETLTGSLALDLKKMRELQ
jgi:hypothetical protein